MREGVRLGGYPLRRRIHYGKRKHVMKKSNHWRAIFACSITFRSPWLHIDMLVSCCCSFPLLAETYFSFSLEVWFHTAWLGLTHETVSHSSSSPSVQSIPLSLNSKQIWSKIRHFQHFCITSVICNTVPKLLGTVPHCCSAPVSFLFPSALHVLFFVFFLPLSPRCLQLLL